MRGCGCFAVEIYRVQRVHVIFCSFRQVMKLSIRLNLPPKRTITIGGSRGGFASRLAMEFEPDVFKGALVTAGGGLGEVATLNRVLDAVWTLKQLVNPNAPLKPQEPVRTWDGSNHGTYRK